MSIVDIGSARFGGWQGWQSIIAAGERVLLAVKTNPLRITPRTPHANSGVEVVENVATAKQPCTPMHPI